jgi:hypothetical protein
MMWGYVWLVEIFAAAAPRRIAATTAVAAALETGEARTAARQAAAGATNDTPNHREDD